MGARINQDNVPTDVSAAKITNNIHVLRDYDMRSKGFGATGNLTNGDLYKELIFKLMY
jgi:hypothetical protein